MKVRRTITLNTLRWLSLAICAATLIIFTTLINSEIGVHFGGGSLIAVSNATLQVGVNELRTSMSSVPPRGFYTLANAWHTDWAVAWRPFHVRTTSPTGTNAHMLVFPLWPLMPLGAAVAAYAHGVLVGMRRARTSECPQCGYDLRKTPVVNGTRTCPECGKAVTIQPPAAATA